MYLPCFAQIPGWMVAGVLMDRRSENEALR